MAHWHLRSPPEGGGGGLILMAETACASFTSAIPATVVANSVNIDLRVCTPPSSLCSARATTTTDLPEHTATLLLLPLNTMLPVMRDPCNAIQLTAPAIATAFAIHPSVTSSHSGQSWRRPRVLHSIGICAGSYKANGNFLSGRQIQAPVPRLSFTGPRDFSPSLGPPCLLV